MIPTATISTPPTAAAITPIAALIAKKS